MSLTTIAATYWPELIGEVIESSIGHLMKRRARLSADILIHELSQGNIYPEDLSDKDEAAAMIFEYMSAAQHGCARRNLKLLAQVFVSVIQQSPPLYADEFLRWSRILADLTREEIILLATLHKHWQGNIDEKEATIPVNAAKRELVGNNKTFSTNEEFDFTAAALIRTGFLLLLPGFEAFPKTTSKLESLLRMARIDDVLAENER